MIRFFVKVLLLLLVARTGYIHRYRLMNVILQVPFIRNVAVSLSRGSQKMPVGLITRVYL